jgi:hypothetical protein
LLAVLESALRMKYQVGERVGFKVQAPVQEDKYGRRGRGDRGESGPQDCGIGTVKSLLQAQNAYILSMSGVQYTVSEDDILGEASWNAESGKWQINSI